MYYILRFRNHVVGKIVYVSSEKDISKHYPGWKVLSYAETKNPAAYSDLRYAEYVEMRNRGFNKRMAWI